MPSPRVSWKCDGEHDTWADRGAHALEQSADRVWISEAHRVGERDLVDADSRNFLGKLHYTVMRHVALDSAAERGGEPAQQPRALVGRNGLEEIRDALQVGERLAVERRTLLRLCPSLTDTT